jgi:hypothetical protein
MNLIIFNFFLSQAIVIPVAIGAMRLKRLDKNYYPFYLFLLLGLTAELASFVFINVFKIGNASVIKVYSLLECCIIIYQMYLWQNSDKYKKLFTLLAGICITFWIIETIVFLNINTWSPYFRVFYAFVIVLLSVNQINSMMFNTDLVLSKNPTFIICLGFIIFFLYQIIYEASYFIGSDKSIVANHFIIGFGYINFAINILYAIAVYFITAKQEDGYSQYFRETQY